MFGDTGNGSRSFSAYNAKHLINMKQTVSISAPDINVASKSSAIQLWLNSENALFSMVMESSINNLQMLLMGHACLSFSALICASCVSVVPALLCLPWFATSLYL